MGWLPGSAATKDQPIQVGAKMERERCSPWKATWNYRHSDRYSTCVYIYIHRYTLWLHHIPSNYQYNQKISYIYIYMYTHMFPIVATYSEVFTNSAMIHISFQRCDHYSYGLNSSNVGWRLMQLWVLPAVILVAAERLGCLWMVMDGYPRARSLQDTDGCRLQTIVYVLVWMYSH